MQVVEQGKLRDIIINDNNNNNNNNNNMMVIEPSHVRNQPYTTTAPSSS